MIIQFIEKRKNQEFFRNRFNNKLLIILFIFEILQGTVSEILRVTLHLKMRISVFGLIPFILINYKINQKQLNSIKVLADL